MNGHHCLPRHLGSRGPRSPTAGQTAIPGGHDPRLTRPLSPHAPGTPALLGDRLLLFPESPAHGMGGQLRGHMPVPCDDGGRAERRGPLLGKRGTQQAPRFPGSVLMTQHCESVSAERKPRPAAGPEDTTSDTAPATRLPVLPGTLLPGSSPASSPGAAPRDCQCPLRPTAGLPGAAGTPRDSPHQGRVSANSTWP